jgi:hydroxymethylpyrimidine pyrophosphatase-like HAD family hydrolase
MEYLALASDFDGTLAHDGVVEESTIQALERFRQSGRKLIMVTGRELADLELVFPRLDLFDRVVAENGAVLYSPDRRQKRILADPPPPVFLDTARRRGVQPLSSGDVIVATSRPNETEIIRIIGELGLELQVIFNKGSVMILPSGVNKKTGLAAALSDLNLSEHNTVAVGDAENDHALLKFCEWSAAVSNAIPALKRTADLVTSKSHGAGVVELIDRILAGDIAAPASRRIVIGHEGEHEISIPVWDTGLLVAGASGSGKSTFITGVVETLVRENYQVCLIDPEGDYDQFPGVIAIGDEGTQPSLDLVMQTLEKPDSQVIVNMLGVSMRDRPNFFAGLLPRLQEMRLRTGRPHWIIIDEAHHLLPRNWAPPSTGRAGELHNLMLITVHPDHVAAAAMRVVDTVVAVGHETAKVIRQFCEMAGVKPPRMAETDPPKHEGMVWDRESGQARRVKLIESELSRKRHKRKYARGELSEDSSFYFKGPKGKLNLRAQNLMTFLQIADGVDDETWQFHLKKGDYSGWFREKIKDDGLAEEAAQIEHESPGPRAGRQRIKEAVERRYTGSE